MAATTTPTKVQPYNKSQLAAMYGIGRDTLNAWLRDVPNLGNYVGRLFTVEQVRRIFDHCGLPV